MLVFPPFFKVKPENMWLGRITPERSGKGRPCHVKKLSQIADYNNQEGGPFP